MTQNLFRRNMHLPALRTRTDYPFARYEVDIGNTGFWEGHEFRLSYEYSITATTYFKFTSTVDFILQSQKVSCDQGGVRFRIYRFSQGAETSPFITNIPFVANNIMSDTPAYTSNVTIQTGGIFSPTGGELAVETIRVRSGNAAGQQATIEPIGSSERGLSAGSYYIEASILTGTNPQGVYNIKWEERPNTE